MDEKNIKVLIVDDEADFRQMMKFWLQARGYSVIEAGEGKAAVDTVRQENPDVIFMDLRMPVMDGAEAIKNIRDFDKDVPIIMISAYVTDPKIKDIMPYDISGIFYKGKDFQDGLTLLEAALRTHKKLKK
ncbi:MAG: response regulator [Candidatus Omnitrophota bacterium]|jgi:two-component system response regulator (stage 0 sporulation protein F)